MSTPHSGTKKWNMVVDVAKCINCHNCALSVQDEYVDNDWPGYSVPMPKHGTRWIDIKKKERGQGTMIDVVFVPMMCQHCDDAPCMTAAKDGAITKRDDGIVVIDPVKAKGQRQIVDACPFGAVWWNDERDVPQAWFFDAHLLDQGWKEPRCVTVCPTGALQSVHATDTEWQRRVTEEGLEPLDGGGQTRPRVLYKNLDRYTRCFVGGSVCVEQNGVVDCVEGARVSLRRGTEAVAEATTDGFGDFRFDRLEEGSGTYSVRIEATGYAPAEREAELGESISLGTISLSPAS